MEDEAKKPENTVESPGLLLNCQQVHALVSQGMDGELSPVLRTRMRLHMMLCSACANFDQQMQLLRRAMRSLPLTEEQDGEQK